jgi:hypothetical protein
MSVSRKGVAGGGDRRHGIGIERQPREKDPVDE